jgi:hypothetical protein
MDLKDISGNPTICMHCKKYYCTHVPPAHIIDNEEMPWYEHRCKGKLIVEFDCITGKVNTKDEYCCNVNTHGFCQYYEDKG